MHHSLYFRPFRISTLICRRCRTLTKRFQKFFGNQIPVPRLQVLNRSRQSRNCAIAIWPVCQAICVTPSCGILNQSSGSRCSRSESVYSRALLICCSGISKIFCMRGCAKQYYDFIIRHETEVSLLYSSAIPKPLSRDKRMCSLLTTS